jgi:acetyl-CoA carboxylase carboxyl transferase subunit beta
MTDASDPRGRKPKPPARPRRSGWLSRFAPGVRSDAKRDAPENLWVKDADTASCSIAPIWRRRSG